MSTAVFCYHFCPYSSQIQHEVCTNNTHTSKLLVYTMYIYTPLPHIHMYTYILSTFFQMPNIDPIETRQSMLEDPSRGSNDTTYFPLRPASTSINCSFSSDIMTPTLNEDFNILMKRSLASTSSFFTSSP